MPGYGFSGMDDPIATRTTFLGRAIGSADARASARWVGARKIAGIVGGCLLMTIGAHVRVAVPGTEVPMTLQLFAVLLIGCVFPPAQAVGGTLLYLTCGTLGMPVFAQGSSGLLGPTGGYIVGFVVAAWLLGALGGGRRAGSLRLLLAGAAAAATVLMLGVAWRAVWFGGDIRASVQTGLMPFVSKAVVEVLLAVTVATVLRRRTIERPTTRIL